MPLTLLLLATVPAVRVAPPLASALAWLGESSWGVYLGQTLIHDGLLLFRVQPSTWTLPWRWGHLVVLPSGSIALVVLGNAARAALGLGHHLTETSPEGTAEETVQP